MNVKPLRLVEVSRSFGALPVLREISLEIQHGEFLAIVGPSGCGKTTLLNLLSGFDQASAGTIERHGQIRMVYQQDGLFPWQTVAENIALGLREVKDPAERAAQITDLVKLIGLEGFEQHYPHQLSGGMRQRVELARALAGRSDILLMDEPFSALDYLTRLRMRRELARILQERPRTVVLVTHDIEEAAQLADRILVLSERPAKIRYELAIAAPRPRDPTSPEVVRAMHRILTELDLERETGEFTMVRNTEQ
jgi:NitT/TauT family transport system ATP-binding protein